MLSLLRTPTEQLKWTSKRKKTNSKSCQKEGARGPGAWGSRPSDGALPTHPLSDSFYHWFLAFSAVHLSCSAGVPAEETADFGRPVFGLSVARTNLSYPLGQ